MQKLVLLLLLFSILACSNKSDTEPIPNSIHKNISQSNNYIGDKQCATCHNQEFNQWQGSHHDLAMQVANDSTVIGNFNDMETTLDGVNYFFTRDGTDFIVEIPFPSIF